MNGKRVLDEYARKRRQRRQLDALEMDNFGDDPHANLAKAKKLPSFIDSPEGEYRFNTTIDLKTDVSG